jgi:hypothetical protein
MKMEAVYSSETLVFTYQTTRHYNVEDHSMKVHGRENLVVVAASA